MLSSSRKPSGRSFCIVASSTSPTFVYGFPSLAFVYGFRRGRTTLFYGFVAGLLVDSAAAGGSKILECIKRFLVCVCAFRTGFRRWFVYGFLRGRKTVFMASVFGRFMVFVVARNDLYGFCGLILFMVSGCYRTAAVSPMETVY